MGHAMGRCEFLDVLEESVVAGVPVAVHLADGASFVDEVREVETADGEDFAIFRDHGRLPVSRIAHAGRAVPTVASYDGKLGGRSR